MVQTADGPQEPKPKDRSTGQYVVVPLAGSALAPSLSIGEYWQRMRARWDWVLGVGLMLPGALAVYLFLLMPTEYVATVSMVHVTTDTSSGSSTVRESDEPSGREETAIVDASAGSEEEAAAILVSRTFTQGYFEDHDIRPVLFPDRWDQQKQTWQDGESVPTVLEAYVKFNEKVRVVEKERSSGLTLLSIRLRDPQLAAELANGLVDRLNAYIKDRDRQRAERRLEYLKAGLTNTQVAEIQSWLYEMMQQQLETIMFADVTDDYAYSVIDDAVAPERPVWTLLKKVALTAVALVVSLVMGGLLAIFLSSIEATRKSIES